MSVVSKVITVHGSHNTIFRKLEAYTVMLPAAKLKRHCRLSQLKAVHMTEIDDTPCRPSTTDCNDLYLTFCMCGIEEAAGSLLLEPNVDIMFDFRNDQAYVE